MYYLDNFCYLCFEHSKRLQNINSQDDSAIVLQRILKFILPEDDLLDSEIPRNICVICLETVNNFFNFKQRCSENINTLNEYVQSISKDGKCNFSSITLTDIIFHKNSKILLKNDCNLYKIPDKRTNLEIENLNPGKRRIFGENDSKINQELIKCTKTNPNNANSSKIYENEPKIECLLIKSEKISDDEDNTENNLDEEIKIKDEACSMAEEAIKDSFSDGNVTNIPNSSNILSDVDNSEKNFDEREIIENEVCSVDEESIKDNFPDDNVPQISNIDIQPILNPAHREFSLNTDPIRCTGCDKAHPFQCTDCNKTDPFRCTVCDKTFLYKSRYERHIRCHTKERPFQCHICHKNFTRQDNLTAHSFIHTGEKRFCCTMCPKSFTTPIYLRRHNRIHNSSRSFKCVQCGMAFIAKTRFNKHVRTHSKDGDH